MIVEAVELQKFKLGAYEFSLGVDGLSSALCHSVFKPFLHFVDSYLVLSNFLLLLLFGFIVVSFSF